MASMTSPAIIGRYVQLMDHWNSVLPGKILQVQHEDVVEDLEGNVRRLLDFCGLDFEPACLEYLQDRAQHPNCELRAGAPAHIQGGARPVAQFRALARTLEDGVGRSGAKPRERQPANRI